MAAGKCKCNSVSRWLIVVTLVVLILVQGFFLDQYFYNHYKACGWQSFFLAYIPSVLLVVYPVRSTEQERLDRDENSADGFKSRLKRVIVGYHKMLAWLLYTVPSILQFVWVLSTFTEEIETTSLFGPKFLKIILCLPAGVFLLLHTIEYVAKPDLNVEWWRVFDLFDTVELLQILIVDKQNSLHISQEVKVLILIFGSISLFFPSFSLWELRACTTNNQIKEKQNTLTNETALLIKRVRVTSKSCQLLFVNIAFLAIRLVLFVESKLDASVFVAKNTVALIVGIIEIASYVKSWRKKLNLRNNCESAFDDRGPRPGNSSRSTASCSTEKKTTTYTEKEHFPNAQRITSADNGISKNWPLDTSAREAKTASFLASLDDISFDDESSEIPLCCPGCNANLTKATKTESRSTQTTTVGTGNDQQHCTCCISKMPRSQESFPSSRKRNESDAEESNSSDFQKMIRQEESAQNPSKYNPVLGRYPIVRSPGKTCVNKDLTAPSSIYLLETTSKGKPSQYALSNRPWHKSVDSTVDLPLDKRIKESSPPPSACFPENRRDEKPTHNFLRNIPVQTHSGLRFPVSSRARELNRHSEACLMEPTRPKNPLRNIPDSNSHLLLKSRARESNPRCAASLIETIRPEETPQNHPRNRPGYYNYGVASRPDVSLKTPDKEFNPHSSTYLRDMAIDSTSEIQLGFSGLHNRPTTFFETPEEDYTMYQYTGRKKRHEIARTGNSGSTSGYSRRRGREIPGPTSTVWGTRNYR